MAELRDSEVVGVLALRLRFGPAEVFVSVNDDTDEVICSERSRVQPAAGVWDERGNRIFWRQVIGRPVHWFWLMQNNQGYTDGVQIELGDPDGPHDDVTMQLVAIASRLSVRVVFEAH